MTQSTGQGVGPMEDNVYNSLKREYDELVEGFRVREEWMRSNKPRLDVLTNAFSALNQALPDAQKTQVSAPRRETTVNRSVFGDKTRTRTTGLVAEIVIRTGRQMTKEQVVAEWPKMYGGYPAWQNVENTIGTALARAVKRGLIDERNGIYFPRSE